jgi:hypothetical protein
MVEDGKKSSQSPYLQRSLLGEFLTAPTGIINPTIIANVFRVNWEPTNVFPFVAHQKFPRSSGDRSRNRMLTLSKQVHFADRRVNIRLMGSSFSDKRAHPDSTKSRLSKPAHSSLSSTAPVAVDLPREANLSAMDGSDVEVLHSSAGLEKLAWTRKLMSRGAFPFEYIRVEQT